MNKQIMRSGKYDEIRIIISFLLSAKCFNNFESVSE